VLVRGRLGVGVGVGVSVWWDVVERES